MTAEHLRPFNVRDTARFWKAAHEYIAHAFVALTDVDERAIVLSIKWHRRLRSHFSCVDVGRFVIY